MSQQFEFYIDIEDSAGNRLGAGPITSASKWSYTARMDKAGAFSFELPARDAKAQLVQRKRKARAWARVGGVWTEVGAGIIDKIERRPKPDGTIVLSVSGDDELRELAGRSVGWLDMSGGGGGLWHTAAVALLSWSAVAPMGWTVWPATGAPNDYIYARFAGESVLSAMAAIADKTSTHFYRSGPRTVTYAAAFTSSGLRAIRAGDDGDDLAAETCAIIDLTETIETFDMLTRIVPLGAGNGETQLTLAASTRSAPTGYTVNKPANWLQHDAAVAAYGVIDAPWIEFKDVRPVSNTDADLQAAADMLFDQALKELTRRAVDMPVATYKVLLAGCSALLRPLQSLRLVYRDVDSGLDVDQDVNILSATWEVDTNGVQTTELELSTSDLWPRDDTAAIVESITAGSVYQAHPQLNANAYVIPYTKVLDDNQLNPAQFRFRFDQEVTQLTRVCFDFQLLPLESTVKSVGASSFTSEASGDHTHGVTVADHTHSVTVANHSHSVTINSHQHDVVVPSHTHSVTLSDHTHSVSVPSHTHGIPNHQHRIGISQGSGGRNVGLFTGGGMYYEGGDVGVVSIYTTSDSGSTTSNSGGSSTPTSGNGGGTTVTSASGGGSTVTSTAGGSQTVTSASGGGSTITSGAGGGTTATSASGGNHTHSITPTVTMQYGVFRDSVGNVFALGDLEYSLDGATWYYFIPGVNGYASLGGGWNRVDLTALLQNTTTLRPASANNLLQIRRKVTGTTGKMCTIDAQLSIRTIIQAIAFT